MSYGVWTEEDIATLKRLWGSGKKSASQIGDELGKSRNAVLGQVHRLKLSGGGSQSRTNGVRRAHVQKAKPPKRDRRDTLPKKPKGGFQAIETKAVPFVEVIPEDAPPSLGIRMMDLRDNICKWPVGNPFDHDNFGFCGHEVSRHGGPYCPYHARRAHQ